MGMLHTDRVGSDHGKEDAQNLGPSVQNNQQKTLKFLGFSLRMDKETFAELLGRLHCLYQACVCPYPSGAPEFIPDFQWGPCYSIFSFICMYVL